MNTYPEIHAQRYPEIVSALLENYRLRREGKLPDKWSPLEDDLLEACERDGISWVTGEPK